MEVFKFIEKLDITFEDGWQMHEKFFFFDSKKDNEDKNSESTPASNTFSALAFTLQNKIISIGTNFNDAIKQIYNPCSKEKYKKITRHKKMILISCKPEKIYVDLLGLHNLFSLLKRIYIGMFFDKFTYKS